MELLQFLLSFFASEYGDKLKPVLTLLEKNNFDIRKTLGSIDLETIAPIIKDFMEKGMKNRPESSERNIVGISPIANIADKDIVYTLNKYFSDAT